MLRIAGFVCLALAVVGTVASFSVVRAGGADGAVYLGVNILLALLGIVLLLIGARRRPGASRGGSAD
ncbi:hypothetical protein [Microbacterium sp.]|uniref:hypothetical protein n=1 Tax=Microbacterium sp. TaxID=51671 RepID=UPI002896F509|nr:hypothetical protein [Microbacterium sp.]